MKKRHILAFAAAFLMLLALGIKIVATDPERSYAERVRETAKDAAGAGDVRLRGTLRERDGGWVLEIWRGSYPLSLTDALSAQDGTRCEVFARLEGGTLCVDTPSAHCILYADDGVYTPPFQPGDEPDRQVQVWVSTKGGTKHHTKPNCSRMTEACQLTLHEAVALGYTACSRCD